MTKKEQPRTISSPFFPEPGLKFGLFETAYEKLEDFAIYRYKK
jgi:hypothetical protein